MTPETLTADELAEIDRLSGKLVPALAKQIAQLEARIVVLEDALREELRWRHYERPGLGWGRCGARPGTSIDTCEPCKPLRMVLAGEASHE